MYICENSGNLDKCGNCSHSMPHEWDITRGCENGMCMGVIGDDGVLKPTSHKCKEIEVKTEIKED